MIELKDVSLIVSDRFGLKNIDATFNDGEIIGIIGRSGSGKSLMLKTISSQYRVFQGDVLIQHRPVQSYMTKDLHRLIASSIGLPRPDTEITLQEFLLLSRIPFKRFLNPFTEYDLQTVEEEIKTLELQEYRNNSLESLPSSILGKAMAAFCLIRKSPVLILDNPTAEMDIKSITLLQKALFKHVMDGNRIVLLASNDLNFIAQTADRILLLDEGQIAASGTADLIDADLIRQYFHIEVFISKNIYNGKPNVHFFPEN